MSGSSAAIAGVEKNSTVIAASIPKLRQSTVLRRTRIERLFTASFDFRLTMLLLPSVGLRLRRLDRGRAGIVAGFANQPTNDANVEGVATAHELQPLVTFDPARLSHH